MTTLFQKALDAKGLSVSAAAHLAGILYVHVWRHYTGRRPITAKYALRYEKALGIPRYELRPDLWEAPATTEAPHASQ